MCPTLLAHNHVNLGIVRKKRSDSLLYVERSSKHGPLVSDDGGPKASLAFTLTVSMRCSFFQLAMVLRLEVSLSSFNRLDPLLARINFETLKLHAHTHLVLVVYLDFN
ncbi:hypothetical protein MVEN_02242500 [Mycena venus]|uniref:Uncharacterized protein n=1 Tax=Mycena venus TaxID=2733690 RepID=A0A8H6X5W4_9AGAR|nr:hypothetical protein MVEN_02242500 [Mycena venus]